MNSSVPGDFDKSGKRVLSIQYNMFSYILTTHGGANDVIIITVIKRSKIGFLSIAEPAVVLLCQ